MAEAPGIPRRRWKKTRKRDIGKELSNERDSRSCCLPSLSAPVPANLRFPLAAMLLNESIIGPLPRGVALAGRPIEVGPSDCKGSALRPLYRAEAAIQATPARITAGTVNA